MTIELVKEKWVNKVNELVLGAEKARGGTMYGATKAALERFTQGLAQEVAEHGISVTSGTKRFQQINKPSSRTDGSRPSAATARSARNPTSPRTATCAFACS